MHREHCLTTITMKTARSPARTSHEVLQTLVTRATAVPCAELHISANAASCVAGELDALLLRDLLVGVVQVHQVAAKLQAEHGDTSSLPAAVVCISAKEGMGVQNVSAALEPLLNGDREDHDNASYY